MTHLQQDAKRGELQSRGQGGWGLGYVDGDFVTHSVHLVQSPKWVGQALPGQQASSQYRARAN